VANKNKRGDKKMRKEWNLVVDKKLGGNKKNV